MQEWATTNLAPVFHAYFFRISYAKKTCKAYLIFFQMIFSQFRSQMIISLAPRTPPPFVFAASQVYGLVGTTVQVVPTSGPSSRLYPLLVVPKSIHSLNIIM